MLTGSGGWVISSLMSTFFVACFLICNQYFKKPGNFLVFWFRVVAIVLLFPMLFFIEWPDNQSFYVFAVLSAFAAGYENLRTFDVAAKYGGGIVSRLMPLVIFCTFPIWFFIDTSLFYEYVDNPLNSIGIILTLAGVVYFSSQTNKSKLNKEAFRMFLPAIFAYAAAAVLNKSAMIHGKTIDAVICYMFIQSLLILPLFGVYNAFVGRQPKFKTIIKSSKGMLPAAVLAAFIWITFVMFKCIAMITIPNPAYLVALNQMAPVMISLFYLAIKYKEEGDVKYGFGVVACAILMAFLTV